MSERYVVEGSSQASPEPQDGGLPAWLGWRAGVFALAAALGGNLIALLVASMAGADMAVQPVGASQKMEIGPGSVMATTTLPLLGATVLLVLLRRRGVAAWRLLAAVGLGIGVLTLVMPLTASATVGTHVALGSMHLLTGLVWFVWVRRAASALERHP